MLTTNSNTLKKFEDGPSSFRVEVAKLGQLV